MVMLEYYYIMKINREWHLKNRVPDRANLNQKIQWHVDHTRICGCRSIPEKIKVEMAKRKPRLVVGVLVNNKDKYLLVREKVESGKEKWLTPGGKVEFGERLEDAAKREIAEETGIIISRPKFLCFNETIFPDYNYHTVIFFYKAATNQSKLRADIEGKVSASGWFAKGEALKLPLVESAEWLFKTQI